MPTAESFNALGAGNGFTSCLAEVNVTNFDRWTTLSGVNKDNPTTSDALIQESLELAMKLYWSWFSMSAPVSAYRFNPYTGVATTDIGLAGVDASSSSYDEPKSRVCGAVSASDSVFDGGSVSLLFTGSLPVRMVYDGDFVGYGFTGVDSIDARAFLASNGGLSRVYLYGYVASEFEPDPFGQPETEVDYAYVSIGGMHFVCYAYVTGVANGTWSADATNLSASTNYSAVIPGVGTSKRETSASITSLDFYTY